MLPAAAVPLLVVNATLAAPDEPPVRVTVIVAAPTPCDTVSLAAQSSRLPGVDGAALPAMVTSALLGEANVAPLAADRVMVKDLFPEKGVVPMGIVKVFGEALPLAQSRVPLVAE